MSNKDNKKSPCPPLHRRYPTTGKCELLKVYQLKRKSNDKNNPDYYVRLMPMSLRELLSDEKYKEEYEKMTGRKMDIDLDDIENQKVRDNDKNTRRNKGS